MSVTRIWKAALFLAITVSLLVGSAWANTVFSESFSGGALPANMERSASAGDVSFSGNNAAWPEGSARSYIRTIDADYRQANFVFTGTVTVANGDPSSIAFYGMGPGNELGDYQTPGNPSVFGEIGPDVFAAGYFRSGDNGITGSLQGSGVGNWSGTHRVVMKWTASTQAALFEVDKNYAGGLFVPDYAETVNGSDNGFDLTNSKLFFGGGNGDIWHNVAMHDGRVLNVAWRGDGYTPCQSYTGLGATPDSSTNNTWNNLDNAGSQTFNNLVYSDGSEANGLNIVLSVQPDNDDLAANCFTPGGADLKLFNGHLNSSGTSDQDSIRIDGLVDGDLYDLYLYSARGAFGAMSTTLTVNGESAVLSGSLNTSTLVSGDNYTMFSGLSVSGGSITISFGGDGGGVFSGFQLVGYSAVPEPGTLALLATGLLGLLYHAWRSRR